MKYKDQYLERYSGVEQQEITFKDNKEKVICIIPPTLGEQNIDLEIAFDLNNFSQPQYGEFSLNGFLNSTVILPVVAA